MSIAQASRKYVTASGGSRFRVRVRVRVRVQHRDARGNARAPPFMKSLVPAVAKAKAGMNPRTPKKEAKAGMNPRTP